MNAFTPTDLSNCDREPIHTPGSIQPHGFLFVLEPATWKILGASTNARDFFWREATALIGGNLRDVFGDDVVPALEQASAHPDFRTRALFVTTATVHVGGETAEFTLVAHHNNEAVILEGERAVPLPPIQNEQLLQHFLNRLESVESIAQLQQLTVSEIRRISGFDRCLLYQFDADWNGAVIAEDRNDTLPTYLNQRFPASDIPRQARELYRRTRFRLIPSNHYRPIPIVMNSQGGSAGALDLSLSVLRAVSPMHLEYMHNMGTGSSMSIAVLRGSELWGLITCHCQEPRWISYAARAACELITQIFALQLAAREQARELAQRVELTRIYTRLLADISHAGNLTTCANTQDLLRLGGATGAVIIEGDHLTACGETPPTDAIKPLVDWLAQQNRPLLFWDHLGAAFDGAKAFVASASGLLAITISENPRRMILWFRPELINVIEWGGKPRKAIELHGEGRTLHPRKSFETWRETVHGHSRSWEPVVISVMNEFRQAIGAILPNIQRSNAS